MKFLFFVFLFCATFYADSFFSDLNVAAGGSHQNSDVAQKKETENLEDKALLLSQFEMNALVTLLILEAGSGCENGPYDVAQVIVNRMNSPLFPDTLSGVVFQMGAFQPFFPLNGKSKSKIRSQVFASREKAAEYASKHQKGLKKSEAMQRMSEVEENLKNPVQMKNSRQFVDGRSFFLGSTQSFNEKNGDVRRRKGCNHFKYGIASEDRKQHKPYKDQLIEAAPSIIVVK